MVASPGLPKVKATNERISASVEMAYQRIMFTVRYIQEWVDHVEDFAVSDTDLDTPEGQDEAAQRWLDRFLDIYDTLNRSMLSLAKEFESDSVATAVVYRAGLLENGFIGPALRQVFDEDIKLREALAGMSQEIGDEDYLAEGWDMQPRLSQMILAREGILGDVEPENPESGEWIPDDVARLVSSNGTVDLLPTSVRQAAIDKGLAEDFRKFAAVFVHKSVGGGLVSVHPDADEALLDSMFVAVDETADLEDSQEDAARVHAATFAYDDVYIIDATTIPADGEELRGHLIGDTSSDGVPLSDLSKCDIIGPIPRSYEMYTRNSLVDNYFAQEEIHPYLNRDIAWGTVDSDEEKSLYSRPGGEKDTSLEEFCAGRTSIFAKTVSKGVARRANLETVDDLAFSSLTGHIMEEVFDGPIYMLPMMVYQEDVSMEWEERFFVVNGRIVTYSGRIISDVPKFDDSGVGRELNHGIREFSRGEDTDDSVVDSSPFHDAKCRLVQRVVDSINGSGRYFGDYVVDACMMTKKNGERTPAVVELNGIQNAGLYGCNVYALVSAMSQSPNTKKIKEIAGKARVVGYC